MYTLIYYLVRVDDNYTTALSAMNNECTKDCCKGSKVGSLWMGL